MAFNLADMVEHAVDLVPERTALVCGDRQLTYAELDARANRLAHHLAEQGVGERDHVAVYSCNSLEFVEAMLAAFKLRAVPINVNYRYVEEELTYLLNNSDAVAIVHQALLSPLVEAVRDRLPKLRHVITVDDGSQVAPPAGSVAYEDALAAASPERDFGPRSDDDLYILYTGGTTGYPKGVMWRHEDVWRVLGGGIDFLTQERIAHDRQMAEVGAAVEPIPVALVLAPLMHGAAQWTTLGGLMKCQTTVVLPQFDADAVWSAVSTWKIATISITGDAMAIPLIDALKAKDYDLSCLVAVASTAAVFSPSVKDQLFEQLPNLFISEAVGSSEGGFNGMRLVEQGKTATDGLINVSPGPDTMVVDVTTLRPVEPGTVGLLARGGNVPLGYFKDPEKSAATFLEVDGRRFSVPGDSARLELDGTITLLGRGSQSINSGGEKIFPEEVESALKAHPKVFDALVVGVADDRWGQRVAALVQARPGEPPTLDELVEHCRTKIAGYKVPRELHLVEVMPRHPSGKPDYRRAKAAVEGEAET